MYSPDEQRGATGCRGGRMPAPFMRWVDRSRHLPGRALPHHRHGVANDHFPLMAFDVDDDAAVGLRLNGGDPAVGGHVGAERVETVGGSRTAIWRRGGCGEGAEHAREIARSTADRYACAARAGGVSSAAARSSSVGARGIGAVNVAS